MRRLAGWVAAIVAAGLHAGAAATESTLQVAAHRFDDDWSGFCVAAEARDGLGRAKCLSLGSGLLVSLGGEWRERVELVRNPDFGLEQDRDTVVLHRVLLHADVRAGSAVRLFAQLGSFNQSGRRGEDAPTDVDRLDLTQGFVEIGPGATNASLRIGRQEMAFGSSRLVSVREGPNVRRSFDGARVSGQGGELRFDGFLVRPVMTTPGVFDDRPSGGETFWGVYATRPVPPAASSNADAYYLGLDRERASFAIGVAREHRHTLGTRLFGAQGGADWDLEAAYQFGGFGSRRIRAWTLATDVGMTWKGLPFQPRLGLKADWASGDRNPSDDRLGTFNALYPKLPYFSEAGLVAPANVADLHPSIRLALTGALAVEAGWNGLWRATRHDAVYAAPLSPIDGTAGRGGRFIGQQFIARLEWTPVANLEVAAEGVYFRVGDALRQVGAENVAFVFASVSYRF